MLCCLYRIARDPAHDDWRERYHGQLRQIIDKRYGHSATHPPHTHPPHPAPHPNANPNPNPNPTQLHRSPSSTSTSPTLQLK